MKCKNCGTENVESTFCANCGTKLELEEIALEENKTALSNEEEIGSLSDDDSAIKEPISQENLSNEELSVSNEVKENKVEDEKILQSEIPKLEKENVTIDLNKTGKQKRKKKFPIAITVIVALVLLLAAYLLYEYLCPRLFVTNMKENYQLEEFLKEEYKIKSSLFIKDRDTVWNLNGYDFYKGKSPSSMPVKPGENKLIVVNGKISKVYTFTVSMEDTSLLITDDKLVMDIKYLDYDGDGIPNEKEVELGLSTYTNDTDGDGLYDNVELIMGLDPKTKDDYNKIRSYDVVQDNKEVYSIYATIKGKGNIANNFLDTIELNVGYPTNFISSDVVTLVTSEEEKPEEKIIYFKKRHSWKLENYSIYDYNNETNELKELETKQDGDYFYTNIEYDHSLFVGKKENAPTEEYKNQIMILIDNSGSMYSREYLENKTHKDYSKVDPSGYGNDVDFKRLSLMKSLVDRLGIDKYEYSVHAFTGDYCSLITQSQDKEAIKEKIDSLKTDCQNFNGTELSGSIRKYAKTFDFETPGVKYMIVLTDGLDAGFFTYELYDFELSSYKKKGIKIITIGLGAGVNSEYLQKIAVGTDGTYLYASDANMLETLISIIENSIKNQETTSIDDKDVTLIADSGFEVTRDGFSFANFGSQDSPNGNCYGFSRLTKLIYLNKLPVSASYEKGGLEADSELVEYTLTDTNKERLKKGNVYGIDLNSDYKFFLYLQKLPDDYRYLGNDGIPYINQKYKDKLISLGYTPIMKEKEMKLTIDGKTETYSKYESSGNIPLFNAEVEEKYKDDYQILQLINRNFRVQSHHTADRIKDNFLKMSQSKTYDYKQEVDRIIGELKTGSPALLSISSSGGGGHSVLATKAYKTNDLQEYIVGIYDSNTPGEEGKAHLKRQTMYYPFSETSYYGFSYNGAGIEYSKMIYAGEY